MTEVLIIGVDCAVKPGNTGFAKAVAHSANNYERCELEYVCTGTGKNWNEEGATDTLGRWICEAAGRPVLLALDAPLGWPLCFRAGVGDHEPGTPLPGYDPGDRNGFFLRGTDLDIQRRMAAAEIPKTPLSVAADKIGRTAAATLDVLAHIRKSTRRRFPFAWTKEEAVQAGDGNVIEVYPAATLALAWEEERKNELGPLPNAKKRPPYALPGYKGTKLKHKAEREKLARALIDNEVSRYSLVGGQLTCAVNRKEILTEMAKTDHALDAAICSLAGWHFLQNRAKGPGEGQRSLARHEGWIWAFNKHESP